MFYIRHQNESVKALEQSSPRRFYSSVRVRVRELGLPLYIEKLLTVTYSEMHAQIVLVLDVKHGQGLPCTRSGDGCKTNPIFLVPMDWSITKPTKEATEDRLF